MTEFDQARPVYVRLVNLLSVDAGWLDEPVVGEKVGVLVMGHGSEVAMPVALRVRDLQRLAVETLLALSRHGDRWAEHIISEHCTLTEKRDGRASSHGAAFPYDGPITRPAYLWGEEPPNETVDELVLEIEGEAGGPHHKIAVVGAYVGLGWVALLAYRGPLENEPMVLDVEANADSIRVSPRQQIDACLPWQYWPVFLTLPSGASFKWAGRLWTKIPLPEIRRLAAGKAVRFG